MRRLISILIITGAALAVAQAAVAQLDFVPITVTSQTLRVHGPGGDTGDVVGGSSVGTSWSLSSEHGSSGGTVSSVLTNGEIVFTIDGALSKGGTTANGVWTGVDLHFIFEISVPDAGDATTPLYFQVSRTRSEHTGTAEQGDFHSNYWEKRADYQSQLFNGRVTTGFDTSSVSLFPGDTLITHDVFDPIPTDTVTVHLKLEQSTGVNVDDSTGTFSETYNFHVITPTPVPEPTSSLTIPSGAAMLIALAKLRGAPLTH
jgi:hypothetical protein